MTWMDAAPYVWGTCMRHCPGTTPPPSAALGQSEAGLGGALDSDWLNFKVWLSSAGLTHQFE